MKSRVKLSIDEALALGYIPIKCLEAIEDVGIFILNRQGEVVCYSKGCEKIDGYSREEVIGKRPEDIYYIIHPDLSEDWGDPAPSLAALYSGKTYRELYDAYETRDRRDVDTLCSSYPIMDEGELPAGSIAVYREVSDYLNMISEMNNRKTDNRQNVQKIFKNGTHYLFEDIIGESAVMKKSISQARIAAETDASVLIHGETGTGKELFAQSIHNAGARAEKPYVAINCSAIPENLLESTLFGTVRGAFTGAVDTPGLLEEARGGTLFLDELNSMPINLQAKLLRFLETGFYRKVGSGKEIKSEARIIAALNEDPFEAIEKKRLRNDLYYRLAAFTIYLPPLRDREGDVKVLANYFMETLSGVLGKKISRFSEDVGKIFERYPWSGNIRELRHVVTQGLYYSDNSEHILKAQCLPQYLLDVGKKLTTTRYEGEVTQNNNLKERLNAYERQMIQEALAKNGGNISQTARVLEISRENLRSKIKKYQLKIKD